MFVSKRKYKQLEKEYNEINFDYMETFKEFHKLEHEFYLYKANATQAFKKAKEEKNNIHISNTRKKKNIKTLQRTYEALRKKFLVLEKENTSLRKQLNAYKNLSSK